MVDKFDCNDRRILTFPAVHPCEGISPVTLLDSLINLSRAICKYQSKFFPTNRRNAREAIRQVGVLRMFFEDIREGGGLNLSDSVVLCFSELHHAFQKIHFLLQDCTREGARVFILMKAHFVASQFLVLIRTVATALDVLPLGSIDVSCEVKELVEMVAKQARKAKIELDPDDEYSMKRVMVILNLFENKFKPEPYVVKWVLDYLRIRSWGECHSEVRFLDEELGFESMESDESNLPLLSSLVGFMKYCRGVLFEDYDFQNVERTDGRASVEMLMPASLNMEDFRCPISLELMTDPVTVSTGQTYDRASIQKWLKAGNLICPKTGERLTSTELVPNSSLRKLIQQFCADNGVSTAKSRKQSRHISTTILPGSPAAAESIKFLCEYLVRRLNDGTTERKSKAAYEARLLAKSNVFNRHCLIEAGAIPALLSLLASADLSFEEHSISALLKLSKHLNGKRQIVDSGGLNLIIRVLKDGQKQESRQMAAATVFYLSSVQKYQRLLGELPEVIPALLEIIRTGNTCGKRNALAAMFGILAYPSNYERVIKAGTVPVLVNLLDCTDRPELITDSLEVLATLSQSFDGSEAILKAYSLSSLVKTLHSLASRAGKECCVSILLCLCDNFGGEVLAVLAKETSLMANLYTLSTTGPSRGSRKARSLINIIHRFHETCSSRMVGNEVRQEQFVHVR